MVAQGGRRSASPQRPLLHPPSRGKLNKPTFKPRLQQMTCDEQKTMAVKNPGTTLRLNSCFTNGRGKKALEQAR